MEEYKSNSHRSKQITTADHDPLPEKKTEKVVTGGVKQRKKSGASKMGEVFVPGDMDSVKQYILIDVLVPSMHKIHTKEFTLEDFSCEHLLDWPDIDIPEEFGPDNPLELGDMPVVLRNRDNNSHFDGTDKYLYYSPEGALKLLVEMLNRCRKLYLKTKDKTFWWQIHSGVNQMTFTGNGKVTIQITGGRL